MGASIATKRGRVLGGLPHESNTRDIGRGKETNPMWAANAFRHIDQVALALNQAVVKFAAVMADSACAVINPRNGDLTTVGVATDLQINPRLVVTLDNFGDIGIVGKQDSGSVGRDAVKRFSEIDFLLPEITNSANGKDAALPFKDNILTVDELDSRVGVDLIHGVVLADPVIVVTQYAKDAVGRIE